MVTGTVQDKGKDSIARATLEVAERVIHEGWTDGGGRSIDNDQNIVGIVRDRSKESGKPFTRPAVVDSKGEVRVFEDVPDAEFGNDAVRRTPRGLVLVSASPRIFDSRCIMWNSTNGSWSYIGASPTNLIPVAITDAGDTLAIHRDPEGNRVVVFCPFGGSWQDLNLPPGFEPTAINNNQDIVGRKREDGFDRPWIVEHGGSLRWLPFLADHGTTPSFISDDGTIVGSAGADHGGHALVWRRV